jgi:putative SOS response-associated peptidase YedK
MCNLYSMTTNQRAILELTPVTQDRTGHLPPLPAIYPNSMAPVVRQAEPVLLTTPDEMDTWLEAPWEVAHELRRPVPDNDMLIVRKGNRKDPAEG